MTHRNILLHRFGFLEFDDLKPYRLSELPVVSNDSELAVKVLRYYWNSRFGFFITSCNDEIVSTSCLYNPFVHHFVMHNYGDQRGDLRFYDCTNEKFRPVILNKPYADLLKALKLETTVPKAQSDLNKTQEESTLLPLPLPKKTTRVATSTDLAMLRSYMADPSPYEIKKEPQEQGLLSSSSTDMCHLAEEVLISCSNMQVLPSYYCEVHMYCFYLFKTVASSTELLNSIDTYRQLDYTQLEKLFMHAVLGSLKEDAKVLFSVLCNNPNYPEQAIDINLLLDSKDYVALTKIAQEQRSLRERIQQLELLVQQLKSKENENRELKKQDNKPNPNTSLTTNSKDENSLPPFDPRRLFFGNGYEPPSLTKLERSFCSVS